MGKKKKWKIVQRLSIAVKLRSKDKFTHHNHNCRQFCTNLTRHWIDTEKKRMKWWKIKMNLNVNRKKGHKVFWFDSTAPITTLKIPFSIYLFSFESVSSATTIFRCTMYTMYKYIFALKRWHLSLIEQQTIQSKDLQLQFFLTFAHIQCFIFYFNRSTVWTRSSGQHLLVAWFLLMVAQGNCYFSWTEKK